MNEDGGGSGRWHKGSRFWRVGLPTILLSWLTIPLVVYFAPAAIEEAIGSFSIVSLTVLGAGGAHNIQQARAAIAAAKGEADG